MSPGSRQVAEREVGAGELGPRLNGQVRPSPTCPSTAVPARSPRRQPGSETTREMLMNQVPNTRLAHQRTGRGTTPFLPSLRGGSGLNWVITRGERGTKPTVS